MKLFRDGRLLHRQKPQLPPPEITKFPFKRRKNKSDTSQIMLSNILVRFEHIFSIGGYKDLSPHQEQTVMWAGSAGKLQKGLGTERAASGRRESNYNHFPQDSNIKWTEGGINPGAEGLCTSQAEW